MWSMKLYEICGTVFCCATANEEFVPNGAILVIPSVAGSLRNEKAHSLAATLEQRKSTVIAAVDSSPLRTYAVLAHNGAIFDIITPLRPSPTAKITLTVYACKRVRFAVLLGDDTLHSRFYAALKNECDLVVALPVCMDEETEKRVRLLSAKHAVPVLCVTHDASFFAR